MLGRGRRCGTTRSVSVGWASRPRWSARIDESVGPGSTRTTSSWWGRVIPMPRTCTGTCVRPSSHADSESRRPNSCCAATTGPPTMIGKRWMSPETHGILRCNARAWYCGRAQAQGRNGVSKHLVDQPAFDHEGHSGEHLCVRLKAEVAPVLLSGCSPCASERTPSI